MLVSHVPFSSGLPGLPYCFSVPAQSANLTKAAFASAPDKQKFNTTLRFGGEFYSQFAAKRSTGGSAVPTDGREAQIYCMGGNRWQLVHVH